MDCAKRTCLIFSLVLTVSQRPTFQTGCRRRKRDDGGGDSDGDENVYGGGDH